MWRTVNAIAHLGVAFSFTSPDTDSFCNFGGCLSLSSAEAQRGFSGGKNPLNGRSAGAGTQPTLRPHSPRKAAFYNERFENLRRREDVCKNLS